MKTEQDGVEDEIVRVWHGSIRSPGTRQIVRSARHGLHGQERVSFERLVSSVSVVAMRAEDLGGKDDFAHGLLSELGERELEPERTN